MAQQRERRVQDLLETEKEYLKEEEHSNTNLPTTENRDCKIQGLTDEEADKFQEELDMKSRVEISSPTQSVAKYSSEDNRDKEELQPKTGNGWKLPYDLWIQSLYEIEKEVDSALSCNATMDESLEKRNPTYPLLLIPVIRCVFKFLDIEDMKNCRLVCREWGSTGKLALANLALIHFHKREKLFTVGCPRLPENFYSRFLDSAALFSAFKISGIFVHGSGYVYQDDSWTIEELTELFEKKQEYIKELTLEFSRCDEKLVKWIDIGSWISKSPMVQKDAKYMTKLSIQGEYYMGIGGEQLNKLLAIPLHLLAHIKDLTLSHCRIDLKAGIKIYPLKLTFDQAIFFQEGSKLNRVLINDVVDLYNAKEVSLARGIFNMHATSYVLDLWGNVILDNLDLHGVDILNREKSEWVIDSLKTMYTPYSVNSKMKITELHLYDAESIDLFTLPKSLQKLALGDIHDVTTFSCSQPILLKNLQYLQIDGRKEDFSFLSHFMNCPQLGFLKLYQCGVDYDGEGEDMKSIWIPKSVKTLKLERTKIIWVDENFCNLEKLVVDNFRCLQELSETKVRVDDIIVYIRDKYDLDDDDLDDDDLNDGDLNKSLLDFLESRKCFTFCKRIFIGKLKWGVKKLERSVLKKHVDVKSSCYVFENGEKGRSLSENAFHDLIPKNVVADQYL